MDSVRKTVNAILALSSAFLVFAVVKGYNEPDHVLRSYIGREGALRNTELSRIVDGKWDAACFASGWRQFGPKNIGQMYPSILRVLQEDGIAEAPYGQIKMLLIDEETDMFEIQRVSDDFSAKRLMLLGAVEDYCLPVGSIRMRSASSGAWDVVEIYAEGEGTPPS